MLGSVFNRHQASTSTEPSKARLRTFRVGRDTCPFSEFRGLGSPGSDIGLPGDIYIDITPGRHALYARYSESWLLWRGPPSTCTHATLLLHPVYSDRCLCCHDSIGWFNTKHTRVVDTSLNTSELLSKILDCQTKLLEESKKRKRDSASEPRRKLSSFATNSSSPTLKNQSPINTPLLSFSPSSTPYSQPAHEIIPTDSSIIQNSEYLTKSDSHQGSVPSPTVTQRDHMSTPNNINERSLQERTSPKRIDLRKVAFGDSKLRSFARRRPSSSTHVRSLSYPANGERSLPQPSPCQPSIHDSATSRIFRKDDTSSNQSIQTTSAEMSREPLVDTTDLQALLPKPISLNLTGKDFVTHLLHHAAASTDPGLSPTTTQRSPVNKEILDVAITHLRRIKEASDANAANLRAANDKIQRLEAENANLRAQLLSPSTDIPLIAEILPAADSDALNGALNAHEENNKRLRNAEGLGQSPRESVGPCDIVRNNPSSSQPDNLCEELESSSASKHSPTPSTSILLEDTSAETSASVHTLPATTVEIMDTLEVEAERSSLGECNSFESNVDMYPLVKEEIVDTELWHASPAPTSFLPMSEILRSVLFAKAGSLLICRICLGTKSGGIGSAFKFQTSKDLPEVMQEHCEKEHPDECEALMNMRDEDLLDLVSKIC